jgi:hypothetical protein
MAFNTVLLEGMHWITGSREKTAKRKMETINESKLWYAVVEDTACININISTKACIIDQHRLTYLSRSIRRLCLLQCAVVTARLPLLVV